MTTLTQKEIAEYEARREQFIEDQKHTEDFFATGSLPPDPPDPKISAILEDAEANRISFKEAVDRLNDLTDGGYYLEEVGDYKYVDGHPYMFCLSALFYEDRVLVEKERQL